MRNLLRLFIKVIATASWLSIVACAPHYTTLAQAQWKVGFQNTVTKDVLTAGLDTAQLEGGWCAEVEANHANRTLVVLAAFPAQDVQDTPDHSSFTCPTGYAIVHRHFLSRDHVRGPSARDNQMIREMPVKPVAGIIVFRTSRGLSPFEGDLQELRPRAQLAVYFLS